MRVICYLHAKRRSEFRSKIPTRVVIPVLEKNSAKIGGSHQIYRMLSRVALGRNGDLYRVPGNHRAKNPVRFTVTVRHSEFTAYTRR